MKIPLRSKLVWLVTAATLAALLPLSARADATSDFQRTQSFQKLNWEHFVEEMHPLDAKHPSRATADLFSLFTIDGQLALRTTVPSTPLGPPVKVKLDDSADWSLLSIINGGTGNGAVVPAVFSLQSNHFDATHTDTLLVRTGQGALVITYQQFSPDRRQILTFIVQASKPPASMVSLCRLVVIDQTVTGGLRVPPLQVSSANFSAFLREHPVEADKYLRPLFHQLGQDAAMAPDPMLAFQVFSDQWTPDPAMAAKVNALVASLGGGDFHSRTRAQNDLAALGKPAAIVLIHLDRAKLSPEQNARLDKIVGPYQPESLKVAAQLRTDPAFLLNCLYSDDPIIRKIAFAQLQTVTKLKLPFDPAADSAARTAAIPPILKQLTDAKIIGVK